MRYLLLALALTSFSALANTDIETNTSRTWYSLDNFSAGLTSVYHGATLADPTAGSTIDNKGNLNKNFTANFDNEASFAYKLKNNFSFGPVVPFLVLTRADKNNDNFILGDAGVKLSHHHTIATDHFALSTNLIVQAPSSDSSKNRGMRYAIKTTPSARYTFSDPRFTLGAFNEGKYYAKVVKGTTLKLWTLPYVNYKASKNFSWNLAYEMEWHRDLGRGALEFTNYRKDIQPGFIWNATKNISVNPYLQFYTNKPLTLRDAGIGTFISATMI